MRELPQEKHGEQEPGLDIERPSSSGPADQWRHSARKCADKCGQRGAPFQRRIRAEVQNRCGNAQRSGECVRGQGKIQRAESKQGQCKPKRFARAQLSGRQRPRRRTAHQGVGIAFEIMIEGRRPRCNQRGSKYRVRHPQPIQRAASSQGIACHRGHHHQERNVGLGQRQIERGAAGLRLRLFPRIGSMFSCESQWATCSEAGAESATELSALSIR